MCLISNKLSLTGFAVRTHHAPCTNVGRDLCCRQLSVRTTPVDARTSRQTKSIACTILFLHSRHRRCVYPRSDCPERVSFAVLPPWYVLTPWSLPHGSPKVRHRLDHERTLPVGLNILVNSCAQQFAEDSHAISHLELASTGLDALSAHPSFRWNPPDVTPTCAFAVLSLVRSNYSLLRIFATTPLWTTFAYCNFNLLLHGFQAELLVAGLPLMHCLDSLLFAPSSSLLRGLASLVCPYSLVWSPNVAGA
jgi:hypothetical protein